MSAYKNSNDDGIPRFEPWLAVLISSFVPAIVALYVHSRYGLPLVVATVALFLAGLVMLRRQTICRRLRRPSDQQPDAEAL